MAVPLVYHHQRLFSLVSTLDDIKIFVRLNVERQAVEELYDEIEAHLLILIETIIANDKLNIRSENFSKIFTPKALTEFLRNKFDNQLMEVQRVELTDDVINFGINFYIKVIVSDSWAYSYGKESTDQDLADTVNYLQNKSSALSTQHSKTTTMNGESVQPLIGALCYDNLAGKMKMWDGLQWLE